jgi:hypothetical protein
LNAKVKRNLSMRLLRWERKEFACHGHNRRLSPWHLFYHNQFQENITAVTPDWIIQCPDCSMTLLQEPLLNQIWHTLNVSMKKVRFLSQNQQHTTKYCYRTMLKLLVILTNIINSYTSLLHESQKIQVGFKGKSFYKIVIVLGQ